MKKRIFLIAVYILMLTSQLLAVEPLSDQTINYKKVWEFGLGSTLVNWSRVSFIGLQQSSNQMLYNLRVNHLMGGVNIYVARELNQSFYLYLQGNFGLDKNDEIVTDYRYSSLYQGGLGLQWRLNPLFKSEYVEPYLCLGLNMLHKNFRSVTSGIFRNDTTGKSTWEALDIWNPNGTVKDKNTFGNLSIGIGMNAWLNNHWGVGLQGEYMMPIEKGLPRFAQFTLRMMYRIGGKDKLPKPIVKYETIEKIVEVEKIVEIPLETEKIVEKPIEVEKIVEKERFAYIYDMFDNINFEFDKYTLTAESEIILDKVAEILKHLEGQRFLITGHTDARGSEAYNKTLSSNRAKAVMEALEKRGISVDMLKSRGVGKSSVAMSASEPDVVRKGDRKVTIERILNIEYWNKLPKMN
ncbi:membrane protein [Porphyromonadaceae bacterium COT-184 OH4590]|nr:membrane protein [Porphyromonadaceae bacterium COT-184 OH4590]